MTKILMTLAVVCLCAAPAFADNGTLSASTLDAMGLSSIQVMSDSDALAVRGMGGDWNEHALRGSFVKVWGGSEAEIKIESPHGDFEAESENGYFAMGQHFAQGANESVASITKVQSIVESIGTGYTYSKIMTKTVLIGAGGGSYAKAL